MLNDMPDPSPPPQRRRGARREQGPAAPASDIDAAGQPSTRPGTGTPSSRVNAPHPPEGRPGPADPRPDDAGDSSLPGPLRAMRIRRRPRRQPGPDPEPMAEDAATVVETPAPSTRPRDRRVDSAERALRGLVTTRGTQISWSAATRARVVAEPTAADLAAAEAEIVLVRRNYTPPEPLRSGRGPVPRQRSGPGPGPPAVRRPPDPTDPAVGQID